MHLKCSVRSTGVPLFLDLVSTHSLCILEVMYFIKSPAITLGGCGEPLKTLNTLGSALSIQRAFDVQKDFCENEEASQLLFVSRSSRFPFTNSLCLPTECDTQMCPTDIPSCPLGYTLTKSMGVCCAQYKCSEYIVS